MTTIRPLIPCVSSAFKAYAYDPATQTLYLQYPSGNVYAHAEVSNDVFAGLEAAESKVKFYAANIRGKYTAAPTSAYSQAEAEPATEGGAPD